MLGLDWRPRHGTPPSPTDARVLRAMSSLENAGASPAPVKAITAWVAQWGWPVTSDEHTRWAAIDYLQKQCGWEWGRYEDGNGQRTAALRSTEGQLVRTTDHNGLVHLARKRGMPEPTWAPTDGTIRCRLRDLECRGLVEKVRGHGAKLTRDGQRMVRAMAEYAS